MEEVTKEEFYRIIKENGLDVCYQPCGNFPYYGEWKFRTGKIFGKDEPIIKDSDKHNYALYNDGYGRRFFIAKEYAKANRILPDGMRE